MIKNKNPGLIKSFKLHLSNLLIISCMSILTACGGGSSDSTPIPTPVPIPDPGNGSNIKADSTIYGGGPLYFGGQVTMNELKHSGFTTINFWTIHVESNGDLIYNDQLIVSNGIYVGRDSWPEEIASLKESPTSVDRVQFGVASYGVPDFERIQTLISSGGTGENSILYKNFQALKEAIPSIDAIDFDDESNYHVESATKFGVMLADLGFKVTFAPYTAQNFWADTYENINEQRPGTVDRVHVQGYAGGAGNQPSVWNSLFGDLKVSMGLWSDHGTNCNDGRSPNEVESDFRGWKDNISGGFIWLYDDVKKCNGSQGAAQYASAINTALIISQTSVSRADVPVPGNSDTFINTDTTLSWQAGFNAISHDVYFSTSAEISATDLLANQSQTSIALTDLQPATTYFWRIDEQHSTGVVTGEVWSFTTKVQGYSAYDRTDDEGSIILAKGENLPNEGAENAFDNISQTKWLDFSSNSWIQFQFSENKAFIISEYTITSANDSPERDPADWILKASNDGVNWQVLDEQNQQYFTERFEKRRYSLSNDTAYSYYRLLMNNHSGNITQLAEIELIEYVQD